MRKVSRDEILDLGAYERIRERFRARVIAEKKDRRFSPAPELSVVFENHDTVLLQIQEMLRTERITSEKGISHELETYNELVPGEDEISATVFVEIPDQETRDRRLVELAGLERTFFLEVAGTEIAGRNETRGILPDRTTAVHYLKFLLGAEAAQRLAGGAPASFIVRHPLLEARTPLPAGVLGSLASDLSE
jgi:hypothetical protein